MEREPLHKGIIVGLSILGCTLLIGGLYLWGGIMAREGAVPTPQEQEPSAHTENTFETQSTSTEIVDLQTDLNAVNLTTIERDLDAIESGL